MSGERAFAIEVLESGCFDDWIALRRLLWPDGSPEERRAEAESLLRRRSIVLLARSSDLLTVGFAEATLRFEGVNGCGTSPVAFLEGLYVRPGWRRRGVARRLCGAVESWAARQGCREFASDTEVANAVSQWMHRALGFEETERVVYYRKPIETPNG